MNKRKLTRIILSVIGSVIFLVIIILIALGFKSIQLNEVGLNYSLVTGTYQNKIYLPSIHYIGFSNKFLKVKSTMQAQNFISLRCLTSDFVPVTLSIEVAYQLPFNDFNNVTYYFKMFGYNPNEILRPIFKNQVQKLVSQYNITSMTSFDKTVFQNRLQQNIIDALAPILSMNIIATLQSLTANYQNQEGSGRTTYLKQQILKFTQDLKDSISVIPSDYSYLVQSLTETADSTFTNIISTETNRLQMVLSWEDDTTSQTKFTNYLYSGNQTLYQDVLAPNFTKTGKF